MSYAESSRKWIWTATILVCATVVATGCGTLLGHQDPLVLDVPLETGLPGVWYNGDGIGKPQVLAFYRDGACSGRLAEFHNVNLTGKWVAHGNEIRIVWEHDPRGYTFFVVALDARRLAFNEISIHHFGGYDEERPYTKVFMRGR